MNASSGAQNPTMQLLQRMFDVELRFLRSETNDPALLTAAFHPDVVVHEPASLPYAGEWRGLEGVGALFCRMNETWSDLSVEGLEAAESAGTVFMSCVLQMTARSNGKVVRQPFAEVLRFREGLMIEGTPFYHDTSEILAALR